MLAECAQFLADEIREVSRIVEDARDREIHQWIDTQSDLNI